MLDYLNSLYPTRYTALALCVFGALLSLFALVAFGVGLLFLTRAYWAAWAAWAVELLLLGIAGAGDVFVAHALPVRLAAAIALGWLWHGLMAWGFTAASIRRLDRPTRRPRTADSADPEIGRARPIAAAVAN